MWWIIIVPSQNYKNVPCNEITKSHGIHIPIPGAICGGVVTQMGKGGIPDADQEMTLDEVKEVSRKFGRANEGNPDPNSSMAVSTAALLGLAARRRTGNLVCSN